MNDSAVYSNRGHVTTHKSDSPMCFPLDLVNAVRATCTYAVMDDNPLNIMNNNKASLIIELNTTKGIRKVACYHPSLIKLWLNYLIGYPLWKRTVTASKTVKRVVGGQSMTSTEHKEIDIFYVPTDEEIATAYRQSGSQGVTYDELVKCRDAIRTYLLPTTENQAVMFVPYSLARSTIYPRDMLPTVQGIIKQSRLVLLGFQKIALSPEAQSKFDEFMVAEEARIKAVAIRPQHQVLSHEELIRLSPEEAQLHNESVYSGMINMMQDLEVDDDLIQKRQANNVLPVAAINRAFHATMRTKPTVVQQSPPNASQWKQLKADYFTICGHTLDVKEEKSKDDNKGINSFARRRAQVERARELMALNPAMTVMYDRIADDIVIRNFGSSTNTMTNAAPMASNYTPIFNPPATTRYNNGPLPTADYSSNNSRIVPASDIQRTMKTVAYHGNNTSLTHNTPNPVQTTTFGNMYSAPGTSNSFANTGGNYASSGANFGVRTHTVGTTSFVEHRNTMPGPNTHNQTH